MSISQLRSILVVDDNPNDRLLVRRQIEKTFSEVNIQEAWTQAQLDQALSEDRYELVITDYQLGWSTGIDILKAVKQLRPECPIVMFTNTGTEEVAVAAMKLGLDDYVLKTPRHFNRLTQAVNAVWQKFQTELRAAELDGRLQALLSQLKVGIFRAAPDGELLDGNQALLKMVGANSTETAQRLWSEQISSQIAASDEALAALEPSAQTQEIQIETAGQLRRSRTVTRWLRISATLNTATRTPVIDGLVEDITARKKAQQKLQETNANLEKKIEIRTRQLERSNKELESFAYSVSHDLRTPVRQIVGLVGLMETHLENETTQPSAIDETVQHYLKIISEQAMRAEKMIAALLNLSRMGRANMDIAAVDMSALVNQVIEQIDPANRDCFAVQAMPVVECDRTLMQAVWQNLINNALKFTQHQPHPQIAIGTLCLPASEPSPQKNQDSAISVQKSKTTTEIVFFIQDNGAGFASSQAEKIFGVFQRGHSQEEFAGSGIGLANVRRIIRRHKGRTWAESKAGAGATFYFSLPKESQAKNSSQTTAD